MTDSAVLGSKIAAIFVIGGVALIGSYLPIALKQKSRSPTASHFIDYFIQLANCFAAGAFFALGLFHLLPEALVVLQGAGVVIHISEHGEFNAVWLLAYAGYIFLMAVEHILFNKTNVGQVHQTDVDRSFGSSQYVSPSTVLSNVSDKHGKTLLPPSGEAGAFETGRGSKVWGQSTSLLSPRKSHKRLVGGGSRSDQYELAEQEAKSRHFSESGKATDEISSNYATDGTEADSTQTFPEFRNESQYKATIPDGFMDGGSRVSSKGSNNAGGTDTTPLERSPLSAVRLRYQASRSGSAPLSVAIGSFGGRRTNTLDEFDGVEMEESEETQDCENATGDAGDGKQAATKRKVPRASGNALSKTTDNVLVIFRGSAFMLCLALVTHSLFEGIVVGAMGSVLDCWVTTAIVCGHKWAASFALSASFQKRNLVMSQAIGFLAVFILASPVGIILGTFAVSSGGAAAGIFNALAAGTLLCIASEIISDEFACKSSRYRYHRFLALLLGSAVVLGLTFAHHAVPGHDHGKHGDDEEHHAEPHDDSEHLDESHDHDLSSA